MKQTKTKLALAVASVMGVSSPGAFAQESNGDESVFEEIVVTAKRREQTIYEVPAAISAFSAETIEKQGITNLIDIGKFVPNLNVTAFSAGHTSSANAFIRGIGLQDHLITTDPGVSVYVDGVYLGRQVGQNWSLALWGRNLADEEARANVIEFLGGDVSLYNPPRMYGVEFGYRVS